MAWPVLYCIHMGALENLGAAITSTSNQLPLGLVQLASDKLTAATMQADGMLHDSVSPHATAITEGLSNARTAAAAVLGYLAQAQQSLDAYLTSIGAPHAPRSSQNEIRPPMLQGDESGLLPGTTLTLEALQNEFAAFQNGEPVESRSAPVGVLTLTEAEAAVLDGIEMRYMACNMGTDFAGYAPLDRYEKRVLRRLIRDFIDLCQRDADRGDLGVVDVDNEPFDLQVGNFDPAHNGIRWHVDDTRKPVVRYVVSLGGGGGTQFSHMTVARSEINRNGYLEKKARDRIDPHPKQYGSGVVTRFTGTTVHATPAQPGKRIFMSLFVVPRSESETSD